MQGVDKHPVQVGGGLVALHACAIILSATLSCAAYAQQAAGQLDPRQAEKKFDALQTEQKRLKETTPVPLPGAPGQSVSADTKPLFKLTRVIVQGGDLVSADQIAETYRPYLGKTVSRADLAAIAVKISDLYRDLGYHLTRAIVPPQDIENGRVRIQVIEGRIAEVVAKGNRADQFGVRQLLGIVAAENPSRRQTLERQLLLVNDLPGVRIADTALEEIGLGTGRFRLIVYVETWRNYTIVSLDDRGTRAIGPLELYLTSSLNSAFVAGDTFGLNLSTIPDTPKELGFGRVFYNLPIGLDGARVGAVASYSESRPGDERQLVDTRTQAETYEVRGSIVPLRTRDASLWLTSAVGLSETAERDVLSTHYRDHIRALTVTADYQNHDTLNGWNYLTVSARQGFNILGASQEGDPFLSRWDGSGTFSKLQFYYTRYQPLSDVWSLKMSTAGQLASRGLLASEEFYLWSPFGRGYYGTEASGDNAIAGSLELRFDQVLNNDYLKGYQLYSFVDRTVAWNFHSDDSGPLSLTLTGVGVRLYLAHDLQAGVEVALPLEYLTPTPQPRDVRVFFQLSKFFKLCPGSAQMHCT